MHSVILSFDILVGLLSEIWSYGNINLYSTLFVEILFILTCSVWFCWRCWHL